MVTITVLVLGTTSLVGLNIQLKLVRSSGRGLALKRSSGTAQSFLVHVFFLIVGLNAFACVLNIILDFKNSLDYLFWHLTGCLALFFSAAYLDIFSSTFW